MNNESDDYRGPICPLASKEEMPKLGKKTCCPVEPIALSVVYQGSDSVADLYSQMHIHRLLFLLYSQGNAFTNHGRIYTSKIYEYDNDGRWHELFHSNGVATSDILSRQGIIENHLYFVCEVFKRNCNSGLLLNQAGNPALSSMEEKLLCWTLSEEGANVMSASAQVCLRTIGQILATRQKNLPWISDVEKMRHFAGPEPEGSPQWKIGMPVRWEYPFDFEKALARLEQILPMDLPAARIHPHEDNVTTEQSSGKDSSQPNLERLTEEEQKIYIAHQKGVEESGKSPSLRVLAKRLGCSHMTVRKKVKMIEAKLGTPLPGRDGGSRQESSVPGDALDQWLL